MLGTPVDVVFFRMPVASPASEVPLIRPTVIARDPAVLVTSPVWAGSAAVGRLPGRLNVPLVS